MANEGEIMIRRHPERCPVIITPRRLASKSMLVKKQKYMVPKDMNVSQLIYILRKRLSLNPQESIFLFTDDMTMHIGSDTISKLYEKHKKSDGLLYMCYDKEATFGSSV